MGRSDDGKRNILWDGLSYELNTEVLILYDNILCLHCDQMVMGQEDKLIHHVGNIGFFFPLGSAGHG